jgi:hypothetical protein
MLCSESEIEVTPEMIEVGVEASDGHLIEEGLSLLSRTPAVGAIWAATNKVAIGRKGHW